MVGVAFAAVPILYATDGIVLATTDAACSFRLDTTGEKPIVISSQAELAALMPVGWSKGETVVATAPDGTAYPIVSGASGAGSLNVSQYINASGAWIIENSAYGTVKAGVAWSVFGGGGTLAESTTSPFVMDTYQPGPNRHISALRSAWPGIAYSGDIWAGDKSAASTLTLVSPGGETTTTNFTGCGAMEFAPKEIGLWSVSLASDVETLVGSIYVSGGFVLKFD